MNGSDAGKKQQVLFSRATHACLAGSAVLALSLVAGVATPASAQGIWNPDYVGGPPPIPPRDVGNGRPTAWAAPTPYSAYPPAPYSNSPPTPYYYGDNPQYYGDGPRPYYSGSPQPGAYGNSPTPLRVSPAEMRRTAEQIGLRLVGTPHRQGRVYVAFAEDEHGLLHHLTFDAYEGTLIENEATGVAAKPVAHPASLNTETTVAPKPSVNPQTSVSPKPSANPDVHAEPHGAMQPNGTTQQSTTAQQTQQKPVSPSAAKDQELSPIKPQPGVKTQPLPDSQIDKD